MKLREDVLSLADLHELARYDPQDGPEARGFHTEREPDGAVTVTADHRPGQAAVVRGGIHVEMMLHSLLRHYPEAARVNNQEVRREEWNTDGEVLLLYSDPESFPHGQHRSERIRGRPNFISEIRYDGLSYGIVEHHYLVDRPAGTEVPRQEIMLASPPHWRAPHYAPVDTYRITHAPDFQSGSREERRNEVFCALHSRPYCLPGQSTLEAIEPQLRVNRDRARQHAAETGRAIRGDGAAHGVGKSWSQTYAEEPLFVEPAGVPARVDAAGQAPLASAINVALYRHNHAGLVPTMRGANGRTDVTISPAKLSYTTSSGETVEIAFGSEDSIGPPFTPPYIHAEEILATLRMSTAGSGRQTEIRVPLACAPLGTAEYPMVIAKPDALQEDELAAMLHAAYYSKRHMAEDEREDIRQNTQVLAARIMRGEEEGFRRELEQFANGFRPSAAPPSHPVTVRAEHGATITWAPPAVAGEPGGDQA